MKLADYALIGITIIASLLITVPLLIGLNDEGYLPIAFAQSFNATTTITNSTDTYDVPAFTNNTGTYPYWEYIYPYVISIPVAFGQVEQTQVITKYEKYDAIISLADNTETIKSVPKRILIDGEWINFRINESDNIIKIESASSSLIFNKDFCSYSIYEGKEIIDQDNSVLPSISWVGRTALDGTDNWVNLVELNDQQCSINLEETPSGAIITSTKQLLGIPHVVTLSEFVLADQIFTDESEITINGIIYPLINYKQFTFGETTFWQKGYWKTTDTITTDIILQSENILNVNYETGIKESYRIYNYNPELSNNKFGGTQTIHTGKTLTIGNNSFDIEHLSGTVLDRQWVLDNNAQIFEIAEELKYDFSIGIELLNALRIIYEDNIGKISLDYANAKGSIPVGGMMDIDPTYYYSTGAPYDVTIGAGVSVSVSMSGANGGSHPAGGGYPYSGGGTGGSASGTFVTDGTTIKVVVGGGGVNGFTGTGGINGGGSSTCSAGGGGYSGVFTGGVISQATAKIVAGGGGGGGGWYYYGGEGRVAQTGGGGGGSVGIQPPVSFGGASGGGGTQVSGGAGGGGGTIGNIAANSGSAFQGGNGVTGQCSGAGGGGGYWGGGGGGVAGANYGSTPYYGKGGGGGSGFIGGVTGGVLTSGITGAASSGNGSVSLTYTLPAAPNAPTNLLVSQNAVNAVYLSWSAPSGGQAPTSYKIQRSVDNTIWSIIINTGTTTTSYTDTGLTPNVLYYYRVYATTGGGDSSSPTNTASITTWNVPGQVVGTGTAGVQPILNWVAPASDGVITNYKIFRDGSLIATLGNVLTYTDITGTTPGQSYEYNISAVSAVGEGAQSADIVVSAGTNPDAPTNLTVTPLAGADHRLDWTAPSYNGGIAISNYIIQRSESSNTGFTTIATVGNVLTYTDQDTNLVLNTIYYYQVLAVNSIGNSPASNVSNGLTGDKPNAITDVTVTAVANKQINVNWSAPNANYYPITSYQVFASENGGVAVSVGTPTITLFQHTNLNIGSTYTYSVYAINSLGTSNISNTPNALAGDIPGVPTNLTVTPIVPSRLDVSWGASTPNAYTPTYTLAFSTNSGSTWNETTYTNLSALIQSHTNLVNGQTYQYKVSATNALGTSAYTADVSGKAGDIPSTPTNIQITTVSTTQLTFAWGIPNDNGYTLTGYLVEQSTDNQQWTILNSNYQSNVYYDSGLTQNTQYYYRVSAINALGTSAPSTPASGQTFGIPNVINNLTTTTISTSQIDLAWSHPALNGYALVGYTVQRSLDTTTWVTQTVTSNNSYQDSQNTSVNTKYYYRVITANTFGSSAPSNVAIGYTLPTATAAVTTTVQSDTQIDLVWNNPSGTAHTGFFIEQSVNAGNTWTTLTTTTNQNLSYNVVGLTPLTDYQFRVSTVNPAGTSGPSPVATAKTFGSPEVPTGTTATPLIGSQIRLDWVGPSNTNGSPVTGY